MTMATEKIVIGIDNETIELKGAEKEAFIAKIRVYKIKRRYN
jgi:hypothetical protein